MERGFRSQRGIDLLKRHFLSVCRGVMPERIALFNRIEREMGKKEVRSQFRKAVFERDNHTCRCCGKRGYDRQGEPVPGLVPLDAHHITDRSQMPNGGYVKENGISVCDDCHLKSERFWHAGEALEGFYPSDLYKLIGSSHEAAVAASRKLTDK